MFFKGCGKLNILNYRYYSEDAKPKKNLRESKPLTISYRILLVG